MTNKITYPEITTNYAFEGNSEEITLRDAFTETTLYYPSESGIEEIVVTEPAPSLKL